MGLFSGLVLGLVVGIGIMAGFSWVMKRRSLQRVDKVRSCSSVSRAELARCSIGTERLDRWVLKLSP